MKKESLEELLERLTFEVNLLVRIAKKELTEEDYKLLSERGELPQ